MNSDTIIDKLYAIENHRFPRKALEAAMSQREEVTPRLLQALERIRDEPKRYVTEPHYFLHFAATYLLAQFREERAYPIFVDICQMPGEMLDSLYGDSITEGFGRILASLSGGDPSGIMTVIRNPKTYEWARGAAVSGLVCMMNTGMLSRDEVVAHFRDLYHTLERKPSHVWGSLVVESTFIHPGDLIDEIRQAFADNLIDEFLIELPEVEEERALSVDESLERHIANKTYYTLIDDTIAELQGWAWFDPPKPAPRSRPAPPSGTVVNTGPDVGRNEPCPCGSGKKYKYCHGKSG